MCSQIGPGKSIKEERGTGEQTDGTVKDRQERREVVIELHVLRKSRARGARKGQCASG